MVINRCHNELLRQLTRTLLDVPQVLDIGMFFAINHENVAPVSNDIPSGTMQYKGSSNQSGHFVRYSFSDPGSDPYILEKYLL